MTTVAIKEQVASVPIGPGLFALRYVRSGSSKAPRVFVQVSPSSLSDVELIFEPGEPKGVLQEPETCAVVAAARSGAVQLTVVPFPGGGSEAVVKLESLRSALFRDRRERQDPANFTLGADDAFPSVPPRALDDHPAPGDRFADARTGLQGWESRGGDEHWLMCHVSRRGDVFAGAGEWVGGPDAPAVIEGFALRCGHRRGRALEYQVLLPGGGGAWSGWVGAGDFAGTRGRGLGLLGLRVRLTGPAGDGARIEGDAAFLGSPLVNDSGRELEFTSYAGADPLVGLRLRIDAPQPAESAFAATGPAGFGMSRSGCVASAGPAAADVAIEDGERGRAV